MGKVWLGDKKRKRDTSDEESELKEDLKKKRKVEEECSDDKSKKKIEKSPEKTGVNRRNAVLFTRKKEAAKTEEKPSVKAGDEKEEVSSKEKTDEVAERKIDEFEFHEPDSPSESAPRQQVSKKRGRKPRRSLREGRDYGDERREQGCTGGPNIRAGPCTGGPTIVDESLFQTYRQGAGLDTDT